MEQEAETRRSRVVVKQNLSMLCNTTLSLWQLSNDICMLSFGIYLQFLSVTGIDTSLQPAGDLQRCLHLSIHRCSNNLWYSLQQEICNDELSAFKIICAIICSPPLSLPLPFWHSSKLKPCLSINRCTYLPALFNSGICNNQCSAIICGNLSFLLRPLSYLPCKSFSQFRFRFFRTHYTLFCFASTRIASHDEYHMALLLLQSLASSCPLLELEHVTICKLRNCCRS